MPAKRCRFIKPSGDRCGCTFGLSKDGFCFNHDPVRRTKSKAAKSRGGQTSAARHGHPVLTKEDLGALDSPQDALRWLEVIGRAVILGRIGDKAAQAGCRAVEAWLRANADKETQEQIEQLRADITALKSLKRPKAVA